MKKPLGNLYFLLCLSFLLGITSHTTQANHGKIKLTNSEVDKSTSSLEASLTIPNQQGDVAFMINQKSVACTTLSGAPGKWKYEFRNTEWGIQFYDRKGKEIARETFKFDLPDSKTPYQIQIDAGNILAEYQGEEVYAKVFLPPNFHKMQHVDVKSPPGFPETKASEVLFKFEVKKDFSMHLSGQLVSLLFLFFILFLVKSSSIKKYLKSWSTKTSIPEDIRQRIEKGEIGAALELARKRNNDPSICNQLTMLKSQFARLMKDNRMGTIDRATFDQHIMKISTALLQLTVG